MAWEGAWPVGRPVSPVQLLLTADRKALTSCMVRFASMTALKGVRVSAVQHSLSPHFLPVHAENHTAQSLPCCSRKEKGEAVRYHGAPWQGEDVCSKGSRETGDRVSFADCSFLSHHLPRQNRWKRGVAVCRIPALADGAAVGHLMSALKGVRVYAVH